jgi:hypothetical protein
MRKPSRVTLWLSVAVTLLGAVTQKAEAKGTTSLPCGTVIYCMDIFQCDLNNPVNSCYDMSEYTDTCGGTSWYYARCDVFEECDWQWGVICYG